jgi:hypothetical protein
LLWFPNRLMSHQQMISDQSLAVMWSIRWLLKFLLVT